MDSLKSTDGGGKPPAKASNDSSTQPIGPAVTPGLLDILLGRGRTHLTHPGNLRLQALLNANRERYTAAPSRGSKTKIIHEIVRVAQTAGDPPGRFLKFHNELNAWVEVDDQVARIKVSHAIRHKPKSPDMTTAQLLPPNPRRELTAPYAGFVGAHQLEQSDDTRPLVSDESILAALGYKSLPASSSQDQAPPPPGPEPPPDDSTDT